MKSVVKVFFEDGARAPSFEMADGSIMAPVYVGTGNCELLAWNARDLPSFESDFEREYGGAYVAFESDKNIALEFRLDGLAGRYDDTNTQTAFDIFLAGYLARAGVKDTKRGPELPIVAERDALREALKGALPYLENLSTLCKRDNIEDADHICIHRVYERAVAALAETLAPSSETKSSGPKAESERIHQTEGKESRNGQ